MKRIKLIGLIIAIISASLISINFFIGDKVIYALVGYVYVKPTWNEAVSTAVGISVFAMAVVGLPSFISGYKNFLIYPSERRIIYARSYTMKQIPLLILSVFVPFSLIMVSKLTNSFGVMIAIVKICREKQIRCFK